MNIPEIYISEAPSLSELLINSIENDMGTGIPWLTLIGLIVFNVTVGSITSIFLIKLFK